MLGFNRLNIAIISSLFLVACGGGGGGSTGGGGSVSTPAPSVTLSSSSSSERVGEIFTLSWSSSNATSCSASGAWSGSKSTSGSEEITETSVGNKTYSLSCSGAGGSSSASTSVEIKAAIIPIDESDLRYRTPDPGDLIAYEYDAEQRQYSSGIGLTSTGTDSGTVDLEYFSTTLTGDVGDAWSEFDTMLEQVSYSSGEIDSNVYAFSSRVFNVADQESFFLSVIEDQYYWGSTYHPPLATGTSFTEEYEVRYDNGFRKFGETTFTVSSREILETTIGDVEVFKYTAQEQWAYAEYFITSWQTRETAELSTTVWIHPKIGILKTESLVKFDDTPSSSGSYVETDLTLEVRSTNFTLPE
jgi:hypothetical protein